MCWALGPPVSQEPDGCHLLRRARCLYSGASNSLAIRFRRNSTVLAIFTASASFVLRWPVAHHNIPACRHSAHA